ncbi:hypothetical protein [Nocardia sp.]|uniref:hypothetical protein n=1 Tax=Nocardia sp. TaxID=1821 RepID=UPI0026085622|nr:hypothetical protein [Nocardia sp.]
MSNDDLADVLRAQESTRNHDPEVDAQPDVLVSEIEDPASPQEFGRTSAPAVVG